MRVGVGPLDQLVGHRLQLRQVHVAVLLGLELEAAGVAQALDGRRPKDADDGAFDLLIALLLDLLRRSPRRIRRRVRSSNGFRTDEHRAEVGAVGVVQKRFPGDADGVGHAGDARGRSCRSVAMIASVRCTEAESGNWTLTSR